MARPLRIEHPNAFYHVMSRGNERKAIFRSDNDQKLFLETLKEASLLLDVSIHAYCLMPNHLHLLIQTKQANLSQFMKRLLGIYTIRFNRRHKRHGHLFQGRYKALLIDQDSYFLQLSRYIHLNPVKAKLVNHPEKFTWSSMRFFLDNETHPYLEKKFTLSQFKTPRDYQRFVNEGIDTKESLPKPIGGSFLGSDQFIKQFKKLLQKSPNKDITGKRELFCVPLKELQRAIADKDQSFQMYCLWRYARLTQSDIGRLFSKTHAAASQNICRFKARLIEDNELQRQLDGVMSEFKD